MILKNINENLLYPIINIIEYYIPYYVLFKKLIHIYKKPDNINIEELYNKLYNIIIRVIPDIDEIDFKFINEKNIINDLLLLTDKKILMKINKKNITDEIINITLKDIEYYIDDEKYEVNINDEDNYIICKLNKNEEIYIEMIPVIMRSLNDEEIFYKCKILQGKNKKNTFKVEIDTKNLLTEKELLIKAINIILQKLDNYKIMFNSLDYTENEKINLILDNIIINIFKYYLDFKKIEYKIINDKNNDIYIIVFKNENNIINIINEIYDKSINFYEDYLNHII